MKGNVCDNIEQSLIYAIYKDLLLASYGNCADQSS